MENKLRTYEISGRFGMNSELELREYTAKNFRGAIERAMEDGLEMPMAAKRMSRARVLNFPETNSQLTDANILTKPFSNYVN